MRVNRRIQSKVRDKVVSLYEGTDAGVMFRGSDDHCVAALPRWSLPSLTACSQRGVKCAHGRNNAKCKGQQIVNNASDAQRVTSEKCQDCR